MSTFPRHWIINAIIVLIFLIPVISFSQVTIKEKVEIKPHSSSINRLSSSGGSTFTARIDWDINYDTPGQVQLSTDWDYVCDRGMCSLVESGPLYRTYSIDHTPSGLYVLYVWHYGWPDSVHVTLTVGETMYQFTIGPYSGWGTPPGGSVHLGDWGGTPYTTPFSRWFRLNVGAESISPWETNGFGIEGRADTCTSISWYSASDLVTLSIVSGGKLGGFVAPGISTPVGSVTMLASDIPSVGFVVSDSGALGGIVTVAATSKGIVDTKTFRIQPFLGNKLKLLANSPIAFGGGGTLRAVVVDASGSEVQMPPDLTFTFKILEGTSWASLHDDYFDRTDSVLTAVPSIVGLFTLDTARYDDKAVRVCVSCSDSRFGSDTASVVILPGMLKLRVTPASLSYGQSAQIEAEGIYSDGVLLPVYPGILYTYEILESPDAGYLIAEGDTTARDVIADIGPVATFVAKEENPQKDSVRVIVKVTAKQEVVDARIETNNAKTPKSPRAFGLAKKGRGKFQGIVEDIGVARVTIQKQTIKLTTQHALLRPLGDGDNKGPKEAKVIDFSRVNPTQVTVSVKKPNGDAAPNYPFTLSAFVRANSGGHDHNDNRPTGRFIHSGDTVRTFSDKTGSDGKATYKYLCSGFGGVDSLYVQGQTDKDTSTAVIYLKMSDFVELTQGVHDSLIGSKPTHRKNHFGTQNLVENLETLADTAFSTNNLYLRYNDMSLIFGGPFDFDTLRHWNTPHQNHREGVSVDISPIGITPTKSEITITKEQLLRWVKKIGIEKPNVGEESVPHHFHVTIK